MGVRNVQHILIETARLDECIEFWLGLGFQIQKVWLADRRYIRFAADGAWIVLTQAPEGQEPAPPVVHLAADRPDGVQQWALDSEHVEVLSEFTPVDREVQTMRVRDPEGRVFAIDAPMPDPVDAKRKARRDKKAKKGKQRKMLK